MILIILVFCLIVFCFIYLRSVLCFHFCQFLSIVHSWLFLRFSLTFICMLRLSFLTCSLLLPNVHLFHFFLNISVNGRILWMICSTTFLGSVQIHIKLFKYRNSSNALQCINWRHYILECILYKNMDNCIASVWIFMFYFTKIFIMFKLGTENRYKINSC